MIEVFWYYVNWGIRTQNNLPYPYFLIQVLHSFLAYAIYAWAFIDRFATQSQNSKTLEAKPTFVVVDHYFSPTANFPFIYFLKF